MLAKVISKNTTLADFLKALGGSRGVKFIGDADRLFHKSKGFSWNLTDGKPGEWFVTTTEKGIIEYLWISFSNRSTKGDVNWIYELAVSRRDEGGVDLLPWFKACFSPEIKGNDEKKRKKAAQFVRNLMRDPIVRRGGQEASDKLHKASHAHNEW